MASLLPKEPTKQVWQKGTNSEWTPLDKSGDTIIARRLLLVDSQADSKAAFAACVQEGVTVAYYNSMVDDLASVLDMIRCAQKAQKSTFRSIAVANHGSSEDLVWTLTSDLVLDLNDASSAVSSFKPLGDVLVEALDRTDFGHAHIDLLACSLAATQPQLIPALEKLYKVDFRASTNNTGNEKDGGDWKLETDGDYDFRDAYLNPRAHRYQEVMNWFNSFVGGIGDAVGAVVMAPANLVGGALTGDVEMMGRGVGGVLTAVSGGSATVTACAIEASIDEALRYLPRECTKAVKLYKLKKAVSGLKSNPLNLQSVIRQASALGLSW